MKYLIIFFTLISCAQVNQNKQIKEANKYHYLQEFYQLRDQLKKETQSCLDYTKNHIEPLLGAEDKGFNNSAHAAANYTPQIYDWKLKTKIKELYLSYEFSEAIMQEHLEISNNIKDCMNEFSNLKYLKKAIQTYPHSAKSSKTILKNYFSYIDKIPLSPLNVLISASLISEMQKIGMIKLHHKQVFETKRKSLELLFSQTGKKSLKAFRAKNYKKMYLLGKQLKKEKDKFQDYLVQAFTFK